MKRPVPAVIRTLVVAVALAASALVLSQAGAGQAAHDEVLGKPVAAGEVLVRFRADAFSRMAEIHRDLDADRSQPLGDGTWVRLHSASRGAQALLTALVTRADVLEAIPNYIVHTTAIPNDPNFGSLWGLNNTTVPGADIHAVRAWDISTGSASTVVGMIDTGVDYTHPDLAANMWSAPTSFTVNVGGTNITCPAGSHGFNAIAFTCNPMDDNGHGTHTAGTVGAVGNNGVGVVGVNWTTRLMALKFLDSGGSGSIGDAINAIDFAIQTKAVFAASGAANVRVLSNSWGGNGDASPLDLAIQRAATADMLFVAAAGNSGTNNDVTPFFPASSPVANVVAVAATDFNDALASFSDYGPTSVDLAAPGVGITSTWWPGGGYAGLSGTSMATPHVAGAAALVLSACALTTAQVKATILGNVDVIPSVTGLVQTNGRLNVDRAIRSCATFPSVSLTSPVEAATFTAPAAIPLAANASDPDGIGRVEFYQGTTLIGTTTTSPYAGTWNNVPAGSYTLTAKAYDKLGLATTSAPVHISVTTGGTRTNVALASNGATASASSTFGSGYAASGAIDGDRKGTNWGSGGGWNDATANAWPDWLEVDFSGAKTISEVDVFSVQDNYASPVDPTATLTFSLYGLTDFTVQYWDGTQWLAVPGGAVSGNRLVWRQVTFAALTTTKIRVLVTGALNTWSRITEVEAYQTSGSGNTPPTVALTAPAEGASYTLPATVTLTANASDSDGIKRVDFYANGGLVGSAAASPYQASWTPAASGSYTLTAVATDNLDASTTSTAVHVTVNSATGTTNVALASNGATASASSTFGSGYAASGAIDGDRKGTNWGSGGGWNDATANAWPDWLEVDFSGSKTISEVDVFSVQDNYASPIDPTATMTFSLYGLTDFTVQYWDGTQWLAVPGGAVSGNRLVWRQVTFAALTTTKIRILVTGALNTWTRIAEVEAYETP